MVEYAYIIEFCSVALFISVSVTQVKPPKNHSATELGESQVICSIILPLVLLAAQKRRKSFIVARSGAFTFFARPAPVQCSGFVRDRKSLLENILLYRYIVPAEIPLQYRSF